MIQSAFTKTSFAVKRLSTLNHYIPIRGILKYNDAAAREFFNREQEQEELEERFYGREGCYARSGSGFHVLYGQPNCGKSRLVTELFQKKKFPNISVSLRGVDLTKMDSLFFRIEKEMRKHFLKDNLKVVGKSLLEVAKKLAGPCGVLVLGKNPMSDAAAAAVEATVDQLAKNLEDSMSTNEDLIAKIDKTLPIYSEGFNIFTGMRPMAPIIFIDEASAVKKLVKRNTAAADQWEGFLRCMVRHSKELRDCIVLMAATDAALDILITRYGVPEGVPRNISMGFLNKEEMITGYGGKKSYVDTCCEGLTGDMKEIIWNTVGGDIFNFERYVTDYPKLLKEEATIKDHEEVSQRMIDSVYETQLEPKFTALHEGDREALRNLYKTLAKSEDGAIEYKELLGQSGMGKDRLDRILEVNAVYCIMGDYLSRDRKKKSGVGLIVPNSPVQLAAIKKYYAEP